VRSVAGGPRFDASEPYTIHHALAPFHAALVLFVYSTLAATSSSLSGAAAPDGADLVLDTDLAGATGLGLVGFVESETPVSAAASFVFKGELRVHAMHSRR
jgi:hypothetical protein